MAPSRRSASSDDAVGNSRSGGNRAGGAEWRKEKEAEARVAESKKRSAAVAQRMAAYKQRHVGRSGDNYRQPSFPSSFGGQRGVYTGDGGRWATDGGRGYGNPNSLPRSTSTDLRVSPLQARPKSRWQKAGASAGVGHKQENAINDKMALFRAAREAVEGKLHDDRSEAPPPSPHMLSPPSEELRHMKRMNATARRQSTWIESAEERRRVSSPVKPLVTSSKKLIQIPSNPQRGSTVEEHDRRKAVEHAAAARHKADADSAKGAWDALLKVVMKDQAWRKTIEELFAQFDSDGGGEIDITEFNSLVAKLGLDLTARQVGCFRREIDTDGGGTISLDEFIVAVSLRNYKLGAPR
jgi:hypothetical protein